ncbi:uncharacterized protein [Euphorbia lathyris]|uniref:uncharacterized protein n=1 Tax=Euphorbia lathyris TaxID=212925 RepID=UPI00331327CB
MLKSKAAKMVKKIRLVLASMGRSLKNKSNALRTRFLIYSLLRDNQFLFSISHNKRDVVEDQTNSIVVYNHSSIMSSVPSPTQLEELVQNSSDQTELTQSLFEDPGGSVIDLVRKSKKQGEEFSLEDEIDHVADLFIQRFHHQIRLQKHLSIQDITA